MHTAPITRIGVDAKERILVTASDDKTVRVWELKSGRLLKVLRVPIDYGWEGRLYAVAISPNGRTIAAAGFTGWNWDRSDSIYIFDVETGNMVQRITGLPEVIDDLSFSKEGKFLAATLGANGLWIYETDTWSLKAKDSQYGANSFCVDFSRDGQLVTTSYDGYIRLYDRQFHLIAKKKTPGGNQPLTAVFSMDGQRIAVGFDDLSRVVVLSGKDLSFLYSPITRAENCVHMASVAWSADGNTLYAGGACGVKDTFQIRAWDKGGKGSFRDFDASDNTIRRILPLRQGGVVYGSASPAIGVLNTDGKRILSVTSSIADFRGNPKGLLVSRDGTAVRFGLELHGKRSGLFSTSSRTLSVPSPESMGMAGPLTHMRDPSGVLVSDWETNRYPKLNGKPLDMHQSETCRSLAISPDGKSFVLGTAWFVRNYERDGRLKWKNPVPAEAWAVNISGDCKVVVAALGDGTIHWYRMEDGQELLALFPHKDGKRWVMWTPSGYYACSPGADELIGWHVNNGKDKSPDFYPVSRFRSVFYRPDVTERVLTTLDEKKALKLADEAAGRKPQEVAVAKMLPPVVTIHSPKDGSEVSAAEVKVRYEARSPSGQPITGIKVLIDGRPAADARGVRRNEQPPVPAPAGSAETSVIIPEKDCEIAIIAENRYSASVPATVQVRWAGKSTGSGKIASTEQPAAKPKLYVLAVGVGQYQNASLKLQYPAKDAKDFAAALGAQKDKLYRDVALKILTDEQATRDGVLGGLEWIEKESTNKDVTMVFLAGHGMDDRNGDYYFLPKDADTESLMRTGIPYSILKKAVTGLPGQVLFFVDTCHSAGVMGDKKRGAMADIDKVVNDLAAPENGIVVFASSTGTQYSLESDAWGNGAFSKALVEGLSGKADYSGKGRITMGMLNLYLSERVKELTQGKQTPTTAIPKIMPDFTLALR